MAASTGWTSTLVVHESDEIRAARARIAERQQRGASAFESWRSSAEPRYKELKRREQAWLLTEAQRQAKEAERTQAERAERRAFAQQALSEQRSRDADKRREAVRVHERKVRRLQAQEAKTRKEAIELKREDAQRRARLHEGVAVQTARMWKAMCLAELRARVPLLG